MAQKFLTNIDLNRNQLINASFEVLGTDPATDLFDGRMYFNSADGVIKIYDSTAAAWRKVVAGIGATAGVIAAGTHASALTIAESNGQVTITPNLATSASAGLLTAAFFTDLTGATDAATAGKLVKRDGVGNISIAAPTADAHAATKAYVDAARSGLDVKASVRVASVAPVAIATALEAGDIIDGVTLVAGDRVLLKDQSTASENGIYVAVASGAGAASRATDADTSAEVTTGMFTFVSEGTVNADNGFVLTTDDTITLGTTNLTFVQFSGAGQITAGAGLTKNGNTIDAVGTASRIDVTANAIDIDANYAGQASITTLGTITNGTWGSGATDIAVTSGGTGSSTESGARTNLASASGEVSGRTTSTPTLARVATQFCAVSASGTSTTTVTHNFGTTDVIVQILEVANNFATVVGDVTRTNANTVVVALLGTITAGDYKIVITG
jgi:hypothetical protein